VPERVHVEALELGLLPAAPIWKLEIGAERVEASLL